MSSDTAEPEIKDWQLGYSLDWLKAAAAPFKSHFKPYAHGAFGIPKERDLAIARKAGRYSYMTGADDSVAAVMISSCLKNPGRHRDFTGQVVSIPAGQTYVSALAWMPGSVGLAEQLLWAAAASGASVWWELHEEDIEAKQLAAVLGFEWQATKVSAGSTITGLYSSGEPVHQSGFGIAVTKAGIDPAELPGICCCAEEYIGTEYQQAILAEVRVLEKWWATHYSSYNKRGTWNAMALRGYDQRDPQFIIKPAEMSKKWKLENGERLSAKSTLTAAAELAPQAMAVVNSIPGRKDRVRFMRLAADGGELTRHADITDREAGVADGRVTRLHIPIQTSGDCKFRSWDARGQLRQITMQERGLYYLDQRKPHACKNTGQQERVHLVIDVYGGPEIREWIRAGR